MLREHGDGRWRMMAVRGEPSFPSLVLMPEGDWARVEVPLPEPFKGLLPVRMVEIVGPTPEAIADEAQALRDTGVLLDTSADIPAASVIIRSRTVFSTLDRQLAYVCVMVVSPRTEDTLVGPLPSVRLVVLSAIRRILSVVDEELDEPSYVGQTRWNADRTEFVTVYGCYGIGSGGLLYGVTIPNSKIKSVNGMSAKDLDEHYPNVG